MRVLIQELINQLHEVQDQNLWMGQNYAKKLDYINEDNAFIRPFPNLHSVAEVLSHLTIWRNETLLKIKSGKGSITEDSEENWLPNEKLMKRGWKEIREQYQNSLLAITALLDDKDDGFLKEKYYDTDFKDYYEYRFVLNGMLHHDIYHLGQLGIIIKFLKEKQKAG